tara:strand:- start:114935 stop:115309 length:375 start_codon:yes stop_codon:yes gene_type:complete
MYSQVKRGNVRAFDHEKLDVYQASLSLVELFDKVTREMPKGRVYLTDQLLRAGTSITLNIAEGAGEYSSSEKTRFYRMAKRSATECAGVLDICSRLQLIGEDLYVECRDILMRIVAMLVGMVRR